MFRGAEIREFRKHIKWGDRRCRKLARTLFHQMAANGPKLEMKQLTLARIVDLGAELAVMALVASRAQSEAAAGNNENRLHALHFLEAGRIRVDALFASIGRNTDKRARALAEELMGQVEPLAEPRGSDHLEPMPREFGSDLTSGRQDKRLSQGGKAPALRSETQDEVA